MESLFAIRVQVQPGSLDAYVTCQEVSSAKGRCATLVVLCWALFGDTRHLIASGNATLAWQNLGQDKTRLAIGLHCQSFRANSVPISKQSHAAAGLS